VGRVAIPDTELTEWVRARIPDEWMRDLEVTSDHEEILVVLTLAQDDHDGSGSEAIRAAAAESTIARFREHTRDARIRIAREAEATLGRTLSWGAVVGDVRALFTTNTTPVMTRLRLPERRVLDTLVDAGVARSRSEALAWCVRRVAATEADWLDELRGAFAHVEQVRAAGPTLA
jgi:hypothetical protein